jgi:NADH dehydrogenase FAD-containing subunit
MSSAKTNVVIVGGGGAGLTIAQALSPKLDFNKHELIVITERSFGTNTLAPLLVSQKLTTV